MINLAIDLSSLDSKVEEPHTLLRKVRKQLFLALASSDKGTVLLTIIDNLII